MCKFKKIFISILTVLFLSNVTFPSIVMASENINSEETSLIDIEKDKLNINWQGDVIFTPEQIQAIEQIAVNEGIEKPTIQPRIGGKKAAITIAKWILKNRRELTNVVGKVLGRKNAVKFGEALKFMEGPLRKITDANDQGMRAIEKIIITGLKEVGMKDSTAKTLAAGVRGILDVLV